MSVDCFFSGANLGGILCIAAVSGSAAMGIFYVLERKGREARQLLWRYFYLKGVLLALLIPVGGVLFCIRHILFGIQDFYTGAIVRSEESLLAFMFSKQPIWYVMMLWIAIGLFLIGIREIKYRYFLFRLNLFDAGKTEQQTVNALCEELGIKRKVRCARSYGIRIPFTVGCLFPKVILPVEEIEKEPLRLMLLHELQHIKQHDVWWISLAWMIACFYWWNPLCGCIYRKTQEYAEYYCDAKVCSSLEESRTYKQMLARYALAENRGRSVRGAGMAQHKSVIRIRLEQMDEWMSDDMKSRNIKLAVVVLAVIFVLANATGYLAGEGFLLGYFYRQSKSGAEVDETEDINIYAEYTTYTEAETENIVVDEDNYIMPDVMKIISWQIKEKEEYRTASFALDKCDAVKVSIGIEPTGTAVQVGVINLDTGKKQLVKITDGVYYRFTVEESGQYAVFVWNIGDEEVIVNGIYSKSEY